MVISILSDCSNFQLIALHFILKQIMFAKYVSCKQIKKCKTRAFSNPSIRSQYMMNAPTIFTQNVPLPSQFVGGVRLHHRDFSHGDAQGASVSHSQQVLTPFLALCIQGHGLKLFCSSRPLGLIHHQPHPLKNTVFGSTVPDLPPLFEKILMRHRILHMRANTHINKFRILTFPMSYRTQTRLPC